MSFALELRSISQNSGVTVVLDGVSISVRNGDFVTLLGPKGCGKSACLQLIGGFEQPSAGHVLLDGIDITRLGPSDRRLSSVFRRCALFPHMNVYENVAFGLRAKRALLQDIRERVAHVIDLVGLRGTEERRPADLSAADRQRAAWGRAIVCNPRVLLLDDPLSVIDCGLHAQMRLELKKLQRKLGIAFVYASGNPEDAWAMSDRIAVLDGGRVVQFGSPWEVRNHPATSLLKSFPADARPFDPAEADAGQLRFAGILG